MSKGVYGILGVWPDKTQNNGDIDSDKEVYDFLKGVSEHGNLIELFACRIVVTDITALTGDQLEALHCGDMVIKRDVTGDHCYIVSFKGATGLCLTYTDCENVETVAYEKTDNTWAYDSTDVTHING
jgi:hypothetical protein